MPRKHFRMYSKIGGLEISFIVPSFFVENRLNFSHFITSLIRLVGCVRTRWKTYTFREKTEHLETATDNVEYFNFTLEYA